MQFLKSILGSIFFGLGIMGTVWFLRNLFRRRTNQAMFFRKTSPGIIIFWNLVLLIGGYALYSSFEKIPLLALFLGLLVGWSVSR